MSTVFHLLERRRIMSAVIKLVALDLMKVHCDSCRTLARLCRLERDGRRLEFCLMLKRSLSLSGPTLNVDTSGWFGCFSPVVCFDVPVWLHYESVTSLTRLLPFCDPSRAQERWSVKFYFKSATLTQQFTLWRRGAAVVFPALRAAWWASGVLP